MVVLFEAINEICQKSKPKSTSSTKQHPISTTIWIVFLHFVAMRYVRTCKEWIQEVSVDFSECICLWNEIKKGERYPLLLQEMALMGHHQENVMRQCEKHDWTSDVRWGRRRKGLTNEEGNEGSIVSVTDAVIHPRTVMILQRECIPARWHCIMTIRRMQRSQIRQ